MTLSKSNWISKLKAIICVILFLLGGLFTASADSLRLYFENDTFFEHDYGYSNGVEVKYRFDKPLWKFDWYSLSIMQMMYTPHEIEPAEIQYGSAPYCGFLGGEFGGYFLKPLTPRKFDKAYLILGTRLLAGTIGENSFAFETQRFVHKILGARKPGGWDNQHPNEIVVNFGLDAYLINRGVLIDERLGINLDLIPKVILNAGTWKDDLTLGLGIRIGNTPNIMPIDEGIVSRYPWRKYGMYLCGGVAERLVWWNTRYDGNVFGDPVYTVETEPLVTELYAGIGAYYKNIEFELLHHHITDEYVDQPEDFVDFLTISLSFNF
jgi:lipid A 3-O-deacylase